MRTTALTLMLALAIPGLATAHHSVAGFFDPDDQIEIEGIVQKVRWRNPHTMFIVDARDESGEVTTWTIESGALAVLRSRGLAREFVQPGDRVRILGDNSLRSRPEMFARNMLLANGEEILLTAGSSPYFNTGRILAAEYDQAAIDAAIASADGIFRVWSTDLESTPRQSGVVFSEPFPVTPEAAAIRDQFDLHDEALLGCTGWSAPRIVKQPLPMEFVRDGENIVMRFEENDSVRTFHMGRELSDSSGELTTFGYSVGRWDGPTLVVETIDVRPDRLDNLGTPFSAEMRLLETFTPTEDGMRLHYTVEITDPVMLTEVVRSGRYWDWRPEMQVRAYDCDEDQGLAQ